ncbi:hypothetical protein [Nocardioides sp. CFH 31398]|uniref:hypothetical protein n=1 Tax=Nocardioides sp. CFH 31398 TaxID=2919579 RepID=UPI001F05701B|nr:hypothetical protein [Nocardioides sp. CFH 31398]MCH1865096.1 hypothetical protein [Nocardioides sp. CFH 31398]
MPRRPTGADAPVRLDRLVERGPLPPATAVAIVASVADALSARTGTDAHGALDVSAVLVSGDVDGPPSELSVLLEDPADGGSGTVADDVRSAGLLLRACLAGSTDPEAPLPPTGGTSTAERNLDRGLRWVLARSTSEDPRKRHRDPGALRADLLTLLPAAAAVPRALPAEEAPGTTVEPEEASPAAVAPAPERPHDPAEGRRRRRWVPLLLVVVTVLAVALGAAAVAGVLPGTDRDPGGSTDAPGEPSSSAPDTPSSEEGSGAAGTEAAGAVTGDVDGDGRGDVVAAFRARDGRAEVTVQRSTDDGLQQSSVGPVGDLLPLLADTDGDGTLELLDQAPGDDPADLVLTGRGDDGWSGTLVDAGQGAVPVAGDYDGDGADEAALLGPDGVVRVADLGGAARSPARPWARNPAWSQADDLLVPADLDGDGDDDLALVRRDPAADEVSLVPLVSDGARFRRQTPSGTVGGVVLHVFRGADTDGDGTDEVLLVPITGGATVTSFVLDGDTLGPGPDLGELPGPGDVPTSGVTDADGDGADDLAVVRVADDGALLVQVLTRGGPGLRALTDEVRLGVGPTRPSVRLLDGSVHRPFLPQ